jgi:phenylalanyl-tRNA synthetase beta chain
LIVKVIEASRIEGSDHLSLTKIDDGGINKTVERDDNGLIQVVCGAPNDRADQLVTWLPPESVVPNTYGKPEPFILGTRQLCGYVSNGMIASARELDLYDEHEGILEIDGKLDIRKIPAPSDTLSPSINHFSVVDDPTGSPSPEKMSFELALASSEGCEVLRKSSSVKPGTSFASVYELDDYLLDIENKSLTHRPDCFGIIGFAREVAAISGKVFQTPDWLMDLSPDFSKFESNDVELTVAIDKLDLSPRYQAIVMAGADSNKKSPIQIQTYLSRVGVRPINAVVDVTNYLMMLTGQPLHAFDYDKLVAVGLGKADIHVRSGRNDEELELLDGRKIILTPDDIVIAAGETAIGLAGAMGGASTAIDDNTKNIIIECASFNLYNLRATQMRHGIFSEAITRFTKGQPAELTAPVLFDAIRLMNDWVGAKCVSNLADVYPNKSDQIKIEFQAEIVNNVLGTVYDDKAIENTLMNAEFDINQTEPDAITATVPYWRSDIHIVEDIVEEIGRLNGYDNIKLTLPKRNFTAVMPSDFDSFRHHVRELLVRAGANEVLSYSFIHGNIIEKSGQDVSNSYRIINSISPELQYYRQSLTPSLLDLIHLNIKSGYDKFGLFEINKTHSKTDGLNDDNVPIESEMAALTVASSSKISGAPYYQAKRIFDYLCQTLGISLTYQPIEKDFDNPMVGPFEYRRSAKVIDKQSGSLIGIVGEYKKSVVKGFKLPDYCAGFEIDSKVLFELVQKISSSYTVSSRYPSSERDICFQINSDVEYDQIINSIENALQSEKLESFVAPIDIYQPIDGETKNITVRIKLTAYDHTLTSDEVTAVINSVSNLVIEKTKAIVI